jgi:hypothetical protein
VLACGISEADKVEDKREGLSAAQVQTAQFVFDLKLVLSDL